MRLAALMREAAWRLERSLSEAGSEIRGEFREFGTRIRQTVDVLENADIRGGRFLDTIPLVGSASNGEVVRFRPSDVLSIPLRDRQGRVIGVAFPSQRGDIRADQAWASVPVRESDVAYRRVTLDARGAPEWAHRALPPPWFDRGDMQRNPVYAHAHAGPDTFEVKVRTGLFCWRTVGVDGATYGYLMAADRNFKRAVKQNPTGQLVMLSCSPGAGSAGRTAAEFVHAAGIDFDVHAANRTVARGYTENLRSALGVEVDTRDGGGTDVGDWSTYPAQRRGRPSSNDNEAP
ncbi:hypothetical protein [Nocardia barduliensis]|uniref:hypothetical protein n=1 Tax=Nocardia barduliensis TaxID=2736643 RepID=UPI00157284E9|nr:hypothetical protein [Nocardia barduliensis]